ncbi:phage integrase N-terminal SAM-like domain-containing protein [Pseudomonas sihuiensis]|jgi:hypothetical protein
METSSKPRLQEQFRAVMRLHHYNIRIEKSYWYWIRYFIRFHQLRQPLELDAAEVNAFLWWSVVGRPGSDICAVQGLQGQGLANIVSLPG